MADQYFIGDGNAGVANAGPLPRVGGVTSQAGVAWNLSIQDNIPMCQECGRDSSKYPRRLSADQTNDDYNSISITPKTSNKSKNGTLSDSQIAKSVLLNNVGFNRERTNKRNVLNDVDFNEVRMPELGQEQQLSFEKSEDHPRITGFSHQNYFTALH